MPFRSQAQRGFMYANHPALAKEFEAKTPKGAKLPYHVAGAKKKIGKVKKAMKKAFGRKPGD